MVAQIADTLPGMTKKNNKPGGKTGGKKRGRKPTGRTPYVTVYVRVRPELAKALEDYRSSLRPKPTQNAVAETALEDFLTAKGFWPPAPTPKSPAKD
jgi:hypothetical protein